MSTAPPGGSGISTRDRRSTIGCAAARRAKAGNAAAPTRCRKARRGYSMFGSVDERLFFWRQGPQPGDHIVEIAIGHLGIIGIAHRRLELRAVDVEPLRDRALDVGVAPV